MSHLPINLQQQPPDIQKNGNLLAHKKAWDH